MTATLIVWAVTLHVAWLATFEAAIHWSSVLSFGWTFTSEARRKGASTTTTFTTMAFLLEVGVYLLHGNRTSVVEAATKALVALGALA